VISVPCAPTASSSHLSKWESPPSGWHGCLTHSADEAADIQEVWAWAAGLEALHARIAGRFVRAEPRRRALAYLRGLLGTWGARMAGSWPSTPASAPPMGCSDCWPRADWDPDLVRDDLRAYVVEHLGDAGAVLVVDETGFLKKGTISVGVQRQYSGTAGKVDNCQMGVFLAYASPKGRAMIDRELYLPEAGPTTRPAARPRRSPRRSAFGPSRSLPGHVGAHPGRRGAGGVGDR
jgi:DDE superfamily endonuclease